MSRGPFRSPASYPGDRDNVPAGGQVLPGGTLDEEKPVLAGAALRRQEVRDEVVSLERTESDRDSQDEDGRGEERGRGRAPSTSAGTWHETVRASSFLRLWFQTAKRTISDLAEEFGRPLELRAVGMLDEACHHVAGDGAHRW